MVNVVRIFIYIYTIMKEKILELRRRGLSYVEIQKQLGCSKSTISYNCKKHGLTDIGLKDEKRKLRGTKVCEHCNIEFSLTGLSKDRIFCCKECYNKSEMKRKLGRSFGLHSSQIQKEKKRSKNEIHFFELCREKYENVLSNEAIFKGGTLM